MYSPERLTQPALVQKTVIAIDMSNGDVQMINIERARSQSRAIALLLALVGASVGCHDKGFTEVNSVSPVASGRVVVGAAEVTFIDITHTDVSARLLLASSPNNRPPLGPARATAGRRSPR